MHTQSSGSAIRAQLGRRRLTLEHAQILSLAGPPSFLLTARPRDHGAMWDAVRRRCRGALPRELGWAAPLLSAVPEPVLCGQGQVEALFRWLDSLPTTAQVSISCQRRRDEKHAGRPEPTDS